MDGAEDQTDQRHDQQHQAEHADQAFGNIAAEVEESEGCGQQDQRVGNDDAAADDVADDVFDDLKHRRFHA